MSAEKQQSWKMNVDVDARNNKLHVNLETINTKPTWKFLQFSIFLSLSRFFIEFKSETGTGNPIPWQHERASVKPDSKSSIHRNWKSKLFRFFKKLKKNPSNAQKRRIARIQTPNLQHPDGKSPAEGEKSVIYELETTSTKPTRKFLRFSIFISLRRFLLETKPETGAGNSIPLLHKPAGFKSKSRNSIPRNWNSRFVRFLKKLKMNPTSAQKRTTPNFQHPDSKSPAEGPKSYIFENPACIGPLLVGALALLSESVWEKDEKGIIIHGCSCALLILAMLFKKHVRSGKIKILLMFLMIATLVCAVLLRLDKYICYYDQFVWKIWNYAAASGCLYEIAEVIFSWLCQSVGGLKLWAR